MKVAYFAGSLRENIDGVSRVLYKIADYNKIRHIPSIYSSPDTDRAIGSETLKLKGVAVPRYKEYRLSITKTSIINKALDQRNFSPDLIHIHSPCTTGLAGLKLAQSRQIPAVATYHTYFPSYLKHHRASFLEKPVEKYLTWFYRQCDVVFAPSNHISTMLTNNGIKTALHLPHGVDNDVFSPKKYSAEWRKKSKEKKILLYAGRLVWEKNLRTLIAAIQVLANKRQDFVLWIAGKGNAENELRMALPEAVFFGFCDSEKLAALYATADIFVFPSDTETFGNVTLEAMSSGTCCIAANKGGSQDLIVDGQNGYTFAPSDHVALARQIDKLLDNPDLIEQLSKNAFEYSRKYNWTEILNKQENIYQELIFKRKSRNVLTKETLEIS